MNISSMLDQLHIKARKNKWLGYFAVFNRIGLAAGFIPSGLQKVLGERFTVLSVNHPMGNYLEAIYHTGEYYTFIGVMQVVAAILLLIPRTVTTGALIYFPIILNICILTFSVRFDGSLFTSPLMTLACLYLLCWDYHKFKFVFPFNHEAAKSMLPDKKELTNRFPLVFFVVVALTITVVVLNGRIGYEILPHNTLKDCTPQCENSDNPDACYEFCNCIHLQGQPLGTCLERHNRTSD